MVRGWGGWFGAGGGKKPDKKEGGGGFFFYFFGGFGAIFGVLWAIFIFWWLLLGNTSAFLWFLGRPRVGAAER